MRYKHLFSLILLSALLVSWSGDDPEDIAAIESNPALTNFQIQTIDYFVDVDLGIENGVSSKVVRKWSPQNRMKLYISGSATNPLLQEVNNTIAELNKPMSSYMDISLV